MRRLLAGMVGLFLAASTACPTYADDSTIAQQLAAELRAAKTNRDLQSFRINVKVEDGVVWMQGSVADVEQRSKALNIARAVSGVRLVVNDLALSDDVVPDVAPPQDKRPAATIVAKPAAKVNEDKTPVAETSVKPVAAYQAQVKPSQGNAVVSPAAAMAGPVRPNMPAPAMTQQLRSQLTPQLMQAQLIQTQMLQRELAESKAIAAATEQLRRQNAIARNQLVNYCGGSGCNAGVIIRPAAARPTAANAAENVAMATVADTPVVVMVAMVANTAVASGEKVVELAWCTTRRNSPVMPGPATPPTPTMPLCPIPSSIQRRPGPTLARFIPIRRFPWAGAKSASNGTMAGGCWTSRRSASIRFEYCTFFREQVWSSP